MTFPVYKLDLKRPGRYGPGIPHVHYCLQCRRQYAKVTKDLCKKGYIGPHYIGLCPECETIIKSAAGTSFQVILGRSQEDQRFSGRLTIL